ncbi:MAG: hypothetical protein IKQ91_03150 [Oscillospiraceae bacterium]|nr:hypothetical protein [Oscillospiraceae bacterium]
MKCEKCGTEFEAANECPRCGTPYNEPSAAPEYRVTDSTDFRRYADLPDFSN